ncbi:MAG TPA: thioredoxin domain-containing protein [Methylomirabilota bacterium]|nr:thioredoxin domain-containing protein [Methylomirabilota bacterium]
MTGSLVTTNRLARETSPYLLQHAHNPVDWYPWGEEAFAKAREENKPILLSVGYSACHWCHVMERESFENADTAALMNRHFVNVKVDREERPDVDHIYMEAVQSLTGHGGWPMTVFLTPDGTPFYGGTYFPPDDRHGLPGFPRLLAALADAWTNRQGEVRQSGAQIAAALGQTDRLRRAGTQLGEEVLRSAFQGVSTQFDEERGGLGGAPKFPQPMIWEFVLRFARRTDNDYARRMVHTTLVRMARGGMYDQLGGGFARYSVDAQWLVPHFEKMLYDNAQLAALYLHGWLALGDPECRRICEETLDYVLREMTDPAGGFYSAQDADSEGHEGKFFVWTPEEMRAVLGAEADAAMAYWGVDRGPNFEGASILYVAGEPDPARVASARRKLFEARERRVHPGRDDKVLAAWNGLMCQALAEAGRALGRDDYLAAAVSNAEFVLGSMRRDGRLMRTWKSGEARLKGYLEDYAMTTAALVTLYEATFDRRWLDEARGLADDLLRLFWDEAAGGFYDTGSDHERLILRPRNLYDNAVPSGSSVAIEALLRLAELTGTKVYEERAVAALGPMADLMGRHPTAFGRFLCALDFHVGPRVELALVAPRAVSELEQLAREAFGRYLPNLVAAGGVAGQPATAAGIPLLEGRGAIDGKPSAYVCRNYACELPVTERDALARQLDAAAGR